jgi:DNA mismatch repair protein MutL
MNSGVYQAYKSIINRGEYPFFALNITVPHDQVDVNVHPMKTEVRFKDEWRIYHVLKSAIEDALSPILNTIPDFEKPELSSDFEFPSTFTPKEVKRTRIRRDSI